MLSRQTKEEIMGDRCDALKKRNILEFSAKQEMVFVRTMDAVQREMIESYLPTMDDETKSRAERVLRGIYHGLPE